MSFTDWPPMGRGRGGPGGGRTGQGGGERGAVPKRSLQERLVTVGHIGRLAVQVWRTSRFLTITTIVLRLLRAVQPVVALYAGKLIIDEIVHQLGQPPPGPGLSDWIDSGRLTPLSQYLAFEFAVVVGNDLL